MKKIKIILPAIILTLTGLVLNYSCTNDKRPSDAFPAMKIPYIALNMALGTQIIITGDREYLEELEIESGMSRKEIKKLFKHLMEYTTKEEVTKRAGAELSNSLKEFHSLPDDKKLKFYVVNILAPYLTMLVNNFDIYTDEKEIQSLFAELFNAPKDEANPLLRLAEGTYSFHYGGTFKVKSIYELNSYLRKEGICLDYNLRGGYANIFKIDYVICNNLEWRPDKKISISVLKRIYPNILEAKLGYAPAEHSDDFLVKDLHHHRAREYREELMRKIPSAQFAGQNYQKLWKSLGLPFDFERMNSMRFELVHKDLGGSSIAQIEKSLIIQTAIHEAKHRIDEIDIPDMRLNLDLEVSAYLTTAITGVYPFLELRKAIEWTEAYFHSTRYIKLRNLLIELWVLADKSLRDDFTEELLRAELLKIYNNYLTIQGNVNFIDLEEFRQRMVPIILEGRG